MLQAQDVEEYEAQQQYQDGRCGGFAITTTSTIVRVLDDGEDVGHSSGLCGNFPLRLKRPSGEQIPAHDTTVVSGTSGSLVGKSRRLSMLTSDTF